MFSPLRCEKNLFNTLFLGEYNFYYKKVLISILENTKLKSGTRGYGAVSIYISRKNEEGKKILLEPVYDIQLKESPK